MSSQLPQRAFSFEAHDEAPLRRGQAPYNQPRDQDTSYRRHSPPPAYGRSTSRRVSDDRPPSPPQHRVPPRSFTNPHEDLQYDPSSARTRLPEHGREEQQNFGPGIGYTYSFRSGSSATPGMDNLGDSSAGGGIAGIAFGIAASNERESGLEAMRALESSDVPRPLSFAGPLGSDRRSYQPEDYNSYEPPDPNPREVYHRQDNSYSSAAPLRPAAMPPAHRVSYHASDASLSSSSPERYARRPESYYTDNPYQRYSSNGDPRLPHSNFDDIDPSQIHDDGEDTLNPKDTRKRPILSLGRPSSQNVLEKDGSVAVGGAATGGILGTFGGLIGRNRHNGPDDSRTASGTYGPVPVAAVDMHPVDEFGGEKSEWLNRQNHGNRRLKWIVGTIFAILVVAAIVGGTVGGILGSRKSDDSSGSSAAAKKASESNLSKDSSEIKKLMHNDGLHRVFPGMDYTPLNAQYPECLSNPPSQDNITKDMAMLSQLTNRVRLYGTDCNQTEMVLEAIDVLDLKDIKVWLGVWLEANKTTNARQIDQMYKILDKNGADPFAGIIVGNEVLFRENMPASTLAQTLIDVKKNITAKKIDLPVATSDVGDDWVETIASAVDIVMANVHPFFGGVPVDQAASWTWNFWQTKDVALAKSVSNKPKSIISEVGWPSEGGNDCAPALKCPSKTAGSVASIANMNKFMDDFVCQSLANGTEYFWFEAFDEPWKASLNSPGKQWEDRWGLMDSERNLKKGLKIPDCDGKTIGS
ncbi:MAG: hypothetical protein M4579_004184 [Chaenotheca gracillima]|nr:MAG: hypothetical protein M4579_004184 [Chaenotheca gracillima]